MNINTKFKDSVFSFLFSDPNLLRELYCALENVDLPEDLPVKSNTLQNVLYMELINDISFVIGGKLVVLIEHQSLSDFSDKDWCSSLLKSGHSTTLIGWSVFWGVPEIAFSQSNACPCRHLPGLLCT